MSAYALAPLAGVLAILMAVLLLPRRSRNRRRNAGDGGYADSSGGSGGHDCDSGSDGGGCDGGGGDGGGD